MRGKIKIRQGKNTFEENNVLYIEMFYLYTYLTKVTYYKTPRHHKPQQKHSFC